MAEESVNCLYNNLKDPLQSGLGGKAPVWAPWRYEEPETWERLFPPKQCPGLQGPAWAPLRLQQREEQILPCPARSILRQDPLGTKCFQCSQIQAAGSGFSTGHGWRSQEAPYCPFREECWVCPQECTLTSFPTKHSRLTASLLPRVRLTGPWQRSPAHSEEVLPRARREMGTSEKKSDVSEHLSQPGFC